MQHTEPLLYMRPLHPFSFDLPLQQVTGPFARPVNLVYCGTAIAEKFFDTLVNDLAQVSLETLLGYHSEIFL